MAWLNGMFVLSAIGICAATQLSPTRLLGSRILEVGMCLFVGFMVNDTVVPAGAWLLGIALIARWVWHRTGHGFDPPELRRVRADHTAQSLP